MRLFYVLLEKMRYHSFWLLDMLKGSKVKKHIVDITYILENFSSKEAIKKRKKSLEELLKHAKQTTSFYNKFEVFEDFPIVNKNIIKDNYTKFQSTLFKNKKKKWFQQVGQLV